MKPLNKIAAGAALVSALVALPIAACYTAPLQTAAGITQLQRYLSGASYQQVSLASGVSMAYLDSDSSATADKPVLLLLHGITSSKDIWLEILQNFPSYRVIAVDMPGHGDSREPQDFDYAVENLSAQLAAFIQQLELPPVHLVGNSLGGLVAGLYTAEHPGRVQSLVLMNSAGIDPPQKSILMQKALTDRSYNPLLVQSADDLSPKLAAVLARPPQLPPPIKQLMSAQELSRLKANSQLFAAVLDDESNLNKLEALLPKFAVPTLLLWGDRDQIFHFSAVSKARRLAPALRSHIIPDCGHLPMLEATAETAAVLQQFFADIAPKGQRAALLTGV